MSEIAAQEGSAGVYDRAVWLLAFGLLNWQEDDLRQVLVDASYEPRPLEDETREAIRAAEVSPAIRLIDKKVDHSTRGRVSLKAASARWPEFTGEFRYVVIFQEPTNQLVAWSDLGRQKVTNGDVIVEYPNGEVAELVTVIP